MFPSLSAQAYDELERHNRLWSHRWSNFLAHVPWPGGQAILPEQDEWRWTVEAFLPFQDFRRSLASVFRTYLPSENWLPTPLRSNIFFLQDNPLPAMPAYLTEFWNMLPAWLAGKVTYAPDELLPLTCSLADPPRFGTDSGRYPQQFQLFEDLLANTLPHTRLIRILDIGCGIGLGTYELAAATACRPLDVLGITPEPLEVWMAENRLLPHDKRRQSHFPDALPPGHAIRFQVGTAEQLPEDTFDIIVCNGLIGGRFFHEIHQLESFLDQCWKRTHSDSHLLIANNFHDGFLNGCRCFLNTAIKRNWEIISPENELRNIHLRQIPRNSVPFS